MKILGACFVMLGCIGLASKRIEKDKKRKHLLQSLERLFLMLYSEVSYRNMTLIEAFCQVKRRMDDSLVNFLHNVGKEWEEKQGDDFSTIWKTHVNQDLPIGVLSHEDMSWLYHFGEQAGGFDKNEQIKQIELLMNYLKNEALESEKTIRESEKLYRTMGLLAGVFIIVLLF